MLNQIENPKERGIGLLFGAMELSGWIVRNTPKGKRQGNDPDKVKEFRAKTLFPKSFFGKKVDYTQIVSLQKSAYTDLPGMEQVLKKTEKMNDKQIKSFVLSYFDNVIAELEK